MDLLNQVLNYDVENIDRTEDKAVTSYSRGETEDTEDWMYGGAVVANTTRKTSTLGSLSGL